MLDVKSVAERVLSKPDYRNRKKDDGDEAARSVLLDLSPDGRIILLLFATMRRIGDSRIFGNSWMASGSRRFQATATKAD